MINDPLNKFIPMKTIKYIIIILPYKEVGYCYGLASGFQLRLVENTRICEREKKLIFAGYKIDSFLDRLKRHYNKYISQTTIEVDYVYAIQIFQTKTQTF